jgi:hypothetical protein
MGRYKCRSVHVEDYKALLKGLRDIEDVVEKMSGPSCVVPTPPAIIIRPPLRERNALRDVGALSGRGPYTTGKLGD